MRSAKDYEAGIVLMLGIDRDSDLSRPIRLFDKRHGLDLVVDLARRHLRQEVGFRAVARLDQVQDLLGRWRDDNDVVAPGHCERGGWFTLVRSVLHSRGTV